MREPYAELTAFQRDLLCVVAGAEKPSGQDLKAELDSVYHKEINHGRLYPNLDALVEEGYVEQGTKDRRTNSYVLTGPGQELLAERRAWEGKHVSLGGGVT